MIITVKHNFETAHRLPFLPGKCENLHGHSWWVEWAFDSPEDENGLTIEYGKLKKTLRDWVDLHLDHGTMLGKDDRIITAGVHVYLGKVFVFGDDWEKLPWPTVEAVATMLADQAFMLTGSWPVEVKVQETHVNSAIWRWVP